MNHQQEIGNWGEGNRCEVDPIELKEVPKNLPYFGLNRSEVEVFIQLARYVVTGSMSPRQYIAVWALSTTTNEAINREPQRLAIGATTAPTATDHIAQRTPAVAPKKQSCRSQAQFSHQLDRPSAMRTKRSTQNTEEKLKTSIAASPSLSRAWRLRSSSAREDESDSFLACAAKTKQRPSAVRTQRCTPLISSALLGTGQPGVV